METQKETVDIKKLFSTVVMFVAAVAMAAAFFLPFVSPQWELFGDFSLKWLFGKNDFISIMGIIIALGSIFTVVCIFAESKVLMAVCGTVPGFAAIIVAYAINNGTINNLLVLADYKYNFGVAFYIYIGSMLIMAAVQAFENWEEIKRFSNSKAFFPWVLTLAALIIMFVAYFLPMLNANPSAIEDAKTDLFQLHTYDLFNESVVLPVETTGFLVPMTILTCITATSGFACLFLRKWGLLITTSLASTISIILAVIKFCTIAEFAGCYRIGLAFYIYIVTTILLIFGTYWLSKTYEETI